jgi:hypothetical protein
VDVMQNHYPERLGMMILINPPTMFWVLYKLLSPFIDQRTKEKAKMLYTDREPNIRDEFPKLFPPHVANYLLEAYMRNIHEQ